MNYIPGSKNYEQPMYKTIFRCKWLGDESKTLEEIAERLEAAAHDLRTMHADGIVLEDQMQDDYAFLMTTNKEVAEKHGLQEMEDEFENEDDFEDCSEDLADTEEE